MSFERTVSVNFGASRTGLSTVAWSLNKGTTWSTAGVSEGPAGSGIYAADITFADDFSGQLSWKTGEVSGQRYAAEDISPPASTVSLPEPAPEGYGPIGTGSVAINQDYPTAGNLSYQTVDGQGIGGALVRAYLASDWATNPAAATVRGQTLTLDTGDWANVIGLDPGNYAIVFTAESYETAVVAVSVA